MIFSDTIEVKTVYPGPYGGGVFTGTSLGKKNTFFFRTTNDVLYKLPQKGEYWSITGEFFFSNEYGETVNVSSAFIKQIPSSIFLKKFLLKHPSFRGFYLGKEKINDLIEKIGEFSLVGLLNDGDYLAISEVVSEPIAKKLCKAWIRIKDEVDVATFLVENDFDSKLAATIMRLCRYNIVQRVKDNPYSLIALSNISIDTLKNIDAVGSKLGIPSDDPRRLIGFVDYLLYRCLLKGDTLMSYKLICSELKRLPLIDILEPSKCIEASLKSRAACVFEENNRIYIQSVGVAYIELSLEYNLLKLAEQKIEKNIFSFNETQLSTRIVEYNTEYKKKYGFEFTSQQMDVVTMALTNRLSVMTGFGGTGKTTVTRAIVELAEEQGRSVHVIALSGKAKERAKESIERLTFTIHGLIQKLRRNNDDQICKESDPLVIIDESSMVDILLMNNLFRAFDNFPFHLLLIGDTAQLPPVGFGVFWHELARSDAIACKHLTQVHRQAEESELHKTAMKIRRGEKHNLPNWNGESEGVYMLPLTDNVHDTLIGLKRNVNATILTPYQNPKYVTSTVRINNILQKTFNNAPDGINVFGVTIKINDPVLVTKNNYKLNLFNGMTGVVLDVGFDSKQNNPFFLVIFKGLELPVTLSHEMAHEIGLTLAYALTIHKSQGSEYNECVIVMDGTTVDRSMLYTALTRAKKLCIIIGNANAYNHAVESPPRIDKLNYGFRYQPEKTSNIEVKGELKSPVVSQSEEGVIFVGMQASGKTTFFKEKFNSTHIHLSLDNVKDRAIEAHQLELYLKDNKSIVVDNTNPTSEERIKYIHSFKKKNYRIKAYYFDSPLSECIARNNLRYGNKKIPEQGVRYISKKLEPPKFTEGFDEIYYVTLSESGFIIKSQV